MDIKQVLQNYDKENITIAVLGSHSALDVCRGAKDLGFKTLVITQKDRGTPYAKYYKSDGELGCVDEVLELENFKDILKEGSQEFLRKRNAIFIPHRSFEVYINNYDAIENDFNVPMFGNRKLLRSEERGSGNGIDQYKIMDEAGIRYPKQFKNPEEIDTIVLVKVQEKERGFERAFFVAKDYEEFKWKSKERIENGEITQELLDKAVIEEFIAGVQVNFNFFYDPINERLELLGTDTRRQTNQEGLMRLTKELIDAYLESGGSFKYEEAGHIAVTVLESLLEPAFEIGEKFVEATKKLGMPVVGPFGLQTMIIPGPPKKEIIVFDVSPRMPGSPGISATPYSGYLHGQNISAGKRVAMQIKDAFKSDKLEEVVS
jgi:5-formaminoimidazole-4-carboxamide-1-(beta)-D-ribofuranosyl 5'-monophosphate synthetase